MNSPKNDQGNADSGPAGIPETELVQHTRNGNVEAFEELLNRHDKSSFDVPLDDVLPAFEENGHIAVDVADWSPQTNDPALQEETRSVIQAAVDRLDKKYQTVFILRDIEGFSTEETAQILEMGIPAIKSRLHRARLSLRKELADYFERTESA